MAAYFASSQMALHTPARPSASIWLRLHCSSCISFLCYAIGKLHATKPKKLLSYSTPGTLHGKALAVGCSGHHLMPTSILYGHLTGLQ